MLPSLGCGNLTCRRHVSKCLPSILHTYRRTLTWAAYERKSKARKVCGENAQEMDRRTAICPSFAIIYLAAMGCSNARAMEAQRARRAREQAGGTSGTMLRKGTQRPAVDRRRKVISVLDARIVNSVLHCTVKWANNSTSEESLISFLKPNARNAITEFQRSTTLALLLLEGSSHATGAEMKQAKEAQARLEAELREVKAQKSALKGQVEALEQKSNEDAKIIKLLKKRARIDMLNVAQLKTHARRLRSHARGLETEMKILTEGEYPFVLRNIH